MRANRLCASDFKFRVKNLCLHIYMHASGAAVRRPVERYPRVACGLPSVIVQATTIIAELHITQERSCVGRHAWLISGNVHAAPALSVFYTGAIRRRVIIKSLKHYETNKHQITSCCPGSSECFHENNCTNLNIIRWSKTG